MKTCTGCNQTKPLDAFSRNPRRKDGRRAKCKQCDHDYYMANRDYWLERERELMKDPGYRAEKARRCRETYRRAPDKQRARTMVGAAARKGILTRPTRCPQCGTTDRRIEAHHRDYTRPLDVEWACSRCHGEMHAAASI